MGEHIIIGNDRRVIVPESLKKIAVQYDHNAETVTFDCPRYWDEHDLSKMNIYINYMRSDEYLGSCLCDRVVVDPSNNNLMHFNWTISGNVTSVAGPLTFLVCVRKADSTGKEITHWNSELNEDMYVSPGLKCGDVVVRRHADVISQILAKLDELQSKVDGLTR